MRIAALLRVSLVNPKKEGTRMKVEKKVGFSALAVITATIGLLCLPALGAAQQRAVSAQAVVQGMIQPDPPNAARALAVPLSQAQHAALVKSYLDQRELEVGLVDNNPPHAQGPPLIQGRPTEVSSAESEFVGNPALLVVGRNSKNTNANNPALASTLAEPAAANNALHVFAAGNFNHAEFSVNGGATWANVALPGGPADAPVLCCDNDVLIDDARRVTFHSVLYINTANPPTNGVVRIFVRRPPPAAACSYTIDPAGAGNNIVPDYPHIGVTKRFLYLTMNLTGAGTTSSGGSIARIMRFNIDQMSDCVTTATTTFSQTSASFGGQRVWVPAEGTNNIEAAYWGELVNATTFRIFKWSEVAAAPTFVNRAISASNFINPDCRGGVGNFDFIERSTSFSIAGFRLRGAAAPGALGGPGFIAFYWNVGPDAVHTQGHIHAAAFALSDFALLAQPHLFNNTTCFGFPIVTANKRGDLGITVAFGGKAGGGGSAAQGAIGVDDEFTTGTGFFNLALVASGTHNRNDGRYGDYFTIHPYEPCEKWFSATSYALSGGTGVANVNSRYVEFGRNQSKKCYDAHRNQAPQAP
jgi:hypothetical protein